MASSTDIQACEPESDDILEKDEKSSDGYVLGRDYMASLRLNEQHHLWREQLGYLLHPEIKVDIGNQEVQVADVGCGTGIWLAELSRSFPEATAQFHGYDIDISQAPPASWLPPNVRFRTWDVFCADEAFPRDMEEAYDVVNVAIIRLVVRDGNPGPILKNLVRMLKPGGYLQWKEGDIGHRTIIKADESLSTVYTDKLRSYVGRAEAHGMEWIRELPDHFRAHGLDLMAADRIPTPPMFYKAENDRNLAGYEEYSRATMDKRGGGEGEKFRALLARAHKEMMCGVAVIGDKLVFVGKKL